MSGKVQDLGDVGRVVADGIKAARRYWNLQYSEMSRRLEAQGRHLPPLALRRIENYQRRVDVADLVAIAAVLKLTPTELLNGATIIRIEEDISH